MIARFGDPETIRREAEWEEGKAITAARYAWDRMQSDDPDDRFLPESRTRPPRLVSWWQWWQQRFGDAAGMPLDRYIEVHGSGRPDAV